MTPQQVFKSTLIILLMLVCAYVLVISARILIVLIVAIIVASAVRPLVTGLSHWHIPHGASIALVYLALAGCLVILTVAIIPPIVNQVAQYMENDSRLAFQIIQAQRWVEEKISNVTKDDVSLVAPDEIRKAVSDSVSRLRRVIPSMLDDLGGTLGDAVLIFVMGAYWLTSHEKATDFLTQLVSPRQQTKTQRMVNEIESMMGGYVRGIIVIASLVGILNFVPMQLLGVPNALSLSFIIAIMTTIPMIGGLIGGLVATFLTIISAPVQFVPAVFLIFIIVQQIENYFLTPRMMANRARLDSLLVIVYTAIGFVMFGIVGALIAVPIMGAVHILLERLVIEPRLEHLKYDQNGGSLLVTSPEEGLEPAYQEP